MVGDSDLDLLVARRTRDDAERILLMYGFKLFLPVAGRVHPAILDFLGFDLPSGKVVHIHLHLRLIVGESLLKNYCLPWEADLLETAVFHPTLPIKVLESSREAILLVVRAALELSMLDPVVLRRWKSSTEKRQLDYGYARNRLDSKVVRITAFELAGERAGGLICKVLEDARVLRDQGRSLRGLRQSLADFRTYNSCEARLRGLARAIVWGLGEFNERVLHAPRPWRRCVLGGGLVIAVLGVDGSGKTSVTVAVRNWLGAEVDVLPIYFGTGDGRPSLLLLPLKVLVPLGMRLIGNKPNVSSHGPVSSQSPTRVYGLLLTMWASVLAVEKRLKLLAARRGADRGMVVLSDRYPQDQITAFNDGPLLPRLERSPHFMREFEARAYALAKRLPPDLVIKLIAAPEVLAVREPTMKPSVIQQRVLQLRQLTFPGAKIVNIDAELPLQEVIRAVKREIWQML